MDVYIVNQDNPAAISAAKMISSASIGDVVPLTDAEFKAYTNKEVVKLPPSPAIDNSNSDLQVVPLDFTNPDVNYLIISRAGKVQRMTLDYLKHKFKDRVTIITTY